MVQVRTQPHVYRRPDLPAFDGLPMIDRAFCSALRVARTLGDDYATEGMDLEEVGLAHTMENLLYTIPQKCEAALGEHPTDVASFERWSNLDMIDRLWWMLREEKTKVRSLVCISICDILKTSLARQPWQGGATTSREIGRLAQYGRGPQKRVGWLQDGDGRDLSQVRRQLSQV